MFFLPPSLIRFSFFSDLKQINKKQWPKCRDIVGSVHECTRTVGGLQHVCTHARLYTIQMLTDDLYGMTTQFFVCLGT